MFTFKDIMYEVVSDILKVQIWTICSELTVRTVSMLHIGCYGSKRSQQMLLLLFLCAFPATWDTKSNFKKVQMVEI